MKLQSNSTNYYQKCANYRKQPTNFTSLNPEILAKPLGKMTMGDFAEMIKELPGNSSSLVNKLVKGTNGEYTTSQSIIEALNSVKAIKPNKKLPLKVRLLFKLKGCKTVGDLVNLLKNFDYRQLD